MCIRGGVLSIGDEMQKARQMQTATQTSGAFEKFVTAQKEQTPSTIRLLNGIGESTLFKKFKY